MNKIQSFRLFVVFLILGAMLIALVAEDRSLQIFLAVILSIGLLVFLVGAKDK